MELIALVHARMRVITDSSTIAQTESLTSLLANEYAGSSFSRAITLVPFVRISVSFDGAAKCFSSTEGSILDIICKQVGNISAARILADTGHTIPGNTLFITGSTHRIKHNVTYARFKLTISCLVPYQFRHIHLPPLIVNLVYKVIEIVGNKKAIHTTIHEIVYEIALRIIWILCNISQRISV